MAGRQEAAGRPWHHPGAGGQLLVFSEFVDTARWLMGLFRDAGFSTEVLEGTLDQRDRDTLQERFLAGDYQVLVSTDAGGEGIDLQSANVMVDWDIPWSLVRLEQRAGRLHRIGQTRPVHIYHLVAPQTREGRVQQVMLDNLTAAAQALRGRIYDLLDATADRAGFDYAAAMAAAQRDPDAVEAIAAGVPDAEVLVARAQEIVAEEDRLKSPVNTGEAMERLAADRLQAINPVIVAAFVEQVARTAEWTLTSGPAAGIKLLRAPDGYPPAWPRAASAWSPLMARRSPRPARKGSSGPPTWSCSARPRSRSRHLSSMQRAPAKPTWCAAPPPSTSPRSPATPCLCTRRTLSTTMGCAEPAGRSRSWCATPALARSRWRGSRS